MQRLHKEINRKYLVKTIILKDQRGYRNVKDQPSVIRTGTIYAANRRQAVEIAVAQWGELPKNKAYQIQEIA